MHVMFYRFTVVKPKSTVPGPVCLNQNFDLIFVNLALTQRFSVYIVWPSEFEQCTKNKQ